MGQWLWNSKLPATPRCPFSARQSCLFLHDWPFRCQAMSFKAKVLFIIIACSLISFFLCLWQGIRTMKERCQAHLVHPLWWYQEKIAQVKKLLWSYPLLSLVQSQNINSEDPRYQQPAPWITRSRTTSWSFLIIFVPMGRWSSHHNISSQYHPNIILHRSSSIPFSFALYFS